MPPRPILKSLSSSPGFNPAYTNNDDPHLYNENPLPFASSSRVPPLDSPHVHFPPSPMMTKVSTTHSAFSYDRKPIEVLPNICALPERGERKVGGNTRNSMSMKEQGGYFHPRAYENESTLPASNPPNGFRTSPPINANHAQSSSSSYERDGHLDVPPLVFDISSESDSDMCGSPPTVGNTGMGGGASHISVHFSGFPMGPSSSTSSGISGIPRDGEEGYELGPSYGGSAKKPRSRRHNHQEQNSDEETSGSVGLGMDIPNRTRSRTKRAANSTGSNSSRSSSPGSGTLSFCEPGLEGCLGGF